MSRGTLASVLSVSVCLAVCTVAPLAGQQRGGGRGSAAPLPDGQGKETVELLCAACFDPRSGDVTEWPSPGGRRSQPYGIAQVDDVIWYSESGVRPNTLVRFDPKTEGFQTWIIPSGGGVVRNMMRTAEGNLALACSGVNRVALVEIQR